MKNNSESGFSYIDVMIALVILMIGVLGVVAALAGGIIQSRGQEQQMIAKQVAASTMEAIMSVKETNRRPDPANPADIRMGWGAIGNIGSNPDEAGVNQGVFVVGEQIVLENAGADNIVGTLDDNGAAVNGVTREIIIRDECDPDRPSYNCLPTPGTAPVRIRSVQVIVRYFAGTTRRQEILTTVLTDYSPPPEPAP